MTNPNLAKAVLTSVKAAFGNISKKKHSSKADECFRDFGRGRRT